MTTLSDLIRLLERFDQTYVDLYQICINLNTTPRELGISWRVRGGGGRQTRREALILGLKQLEAERCASNSS